MSTEFENEDPREVLRRALTAEVLEEVAAERTRQDAKWGEQNHPDGTGKSIFADYAGIAKRRCDSAAKSGKLTWAHILEEEFWEALAEDGEEALRMELIQAIAVGVGWVEAIDRRRKKREQANGEGQG